MTTLDFELEISPGTGDTYPVLARAPGGEAAATMRLPMALAELDRQLAVIRDAVLASSAVSRRLPTEDEQSVQALGRGLFEAVVTDEVRGLYLASGQRAREQGSPLRLVLRVRPPELARLPWEFLFDPVQQDYLGLSVPLVRYPEILVPRLPLQVAAPLRILGMVARPSDQHVLDVTNEQQRLRNALAGLERDGLVELSWVAGQTYGDLQNALDKGPWHIFHFVGHGGYDRVADEGTVALADNDGRTSHVGADDLSRLLAEHHTLRLVLLNACDTGRGSTLDAFSSNAGALMRRGIPAVVAMQFEISDSAAIRFTEAFYQNVAKELPVDTGVMRARRALRLAKKDTLEWGTPVLYLRAPDGRIFNTAAVRPPARPSFFQDQLAMPDVEAMYDDALTAFWTEQWDQAVVLLRQLLACQHDHPGATVKLEEAVRQQQLGTGYAQACGAAEALDWEQAVVGFTAVADVDPTYRDVGERLEIAQRQRQIAGLQDETRRLHRAGRWAAVIKVGAWLHTLDPATADPDGLVTSARTELAAAERAAQLAARYRSGLRLLNAGQWPQAIEALEQLDPTYRDTSALLARARRELPDPPMPPPTSPRIIPDLHFGADGEGDKAEAPAAPEPAGENLTHQEVLHQELVRLWGELVRDPKASPHLGDLGEPAEDPAVLWRELHLAFWRLNTQQVERWKRQVRQRCGRLGLPEGAEPGSAGAAVVVPAFDLIGCPELRLGQPQAERRKWVLAGLGADDAERFPELVGALADVLLLLEEDKHIRIGWQFPYRERELGGREHSGDFRYFVRQRLRMLARKNNGDAAEFQLLVDLDEAVRSIVYDPVPAPSSWWAKNVGDLFHWMHDRSQWMNRTSPASCRINGLIGHYKDCRNLTYHWMNIPKPPPTGSEHGQVLWTLRMWSEVGGKAIRGRVIYGSSEL